MAFAPSPWLRSSVRSLLYPGSGEAPPDCPVEPAGSSAPGTVTLYTTVGSVTPLSITLLFPGLKTGIGAVAAMQAQPSTTNWDNYQLQEVVNTASNGCPANWGNMYAGGGTFTVGIGGQAEVPVNGVATLVGPVFPAQENTFYDQHTLTSGVSLPELRA